MLVHGGRADWGFMDGTAGKGPIGDVAPSLLAKATSFVKEHRLPGAAVGVVHGDDLAWSAGIGFADVGERRPPDGTTLYRIASITKTFTGTAIMQLRDEGLLHLDDPAVAYLPELKDAGSSFGPIETVTIRRMLSHESGLSSEPPDTDWTTPSYQGDPSKNLARAAETGTRIPPNAQQKYSNLAYQLLGEIVTRRSGVAYPDYVRANILDPLGMSGSAFEPLPDSLLPRRATGYMPRLFSDDLEVSVFPPTVWAEGGLWSSVGDLARWISFQLREDGGERAGAQILSGATLKEMHTARYLGDVEWIEAWCISWYAVRRADAVWIQHSGGLHGFTTNVCFHPKDRVGAIALLNGVAAADELAMDLATIARDAVRAEPVAIEPPAPLPDAYRSLLGLYLDPHEGAVSRLEWRDGKLALVDPDQPRWRPTFAPTEDPDVFLVEPGVRESGERVIFRRTADGRVASMFLTAATLVRLDPVVDVE
jgi:CubicO group peptidase (beta-lactamase class C family)